MAKFLTGNELNFELEKIFEKAEEQLILISPYIKLHDRYISTLSSKKNDHKLNIIIVFGKNETDYSRSMKQEDFNFFKEFPNIEIRYEKRLHAKYYANEVSAILTSMNLYDFSQDNNIEAGVMTKVTIFNNIANNLRSNLTGEDGFDSAAWSYFSRVISQSELLFKKMPEYESSMLGFTKKYKSSNIEIDTLSEFFAKKIKTESTKKDLASVKSVIPPILHPPSNNNPVVSSDIKLLSTTALSKEIGLSSKELFTKFEKLQWIERKNDDWVLTEEGKNKGAQTKKGQYGEYIAWPENIIGMVK